MTNRLLQKHTLVVVQVTDETLRQTQALKDDLQLLHTAQDRLQQLWERQSHKQEDVLTAKAKLVQDLNTSILVCLA